MQVLANAFALRTWVLLNRKFMILCSYWAAVNREFNFPTSNWIKLIDRATMVWSGLSLLTCGYKFFNPAPRLSPHIDHPLYQLNATLLLERRRNQLATWRWSDLVQLNYLPNLQTFGSLYYGLVFITLAMALVWRLYLIFIRRNDLEELKRWRPARESEGHHGYSEPRGQDEPFDAKLETIQFFMRGPSGREREQQDTNRLIDYYFERNFSSIVLARYLDKGDESIDGQDGNLAGDCNCEPYDTEVGDNTGDDGDYTTDTDSDDDDAADLIASDDDDDDDDDDDTEVTGHDNEGRVVANCAQVGRQEARFGMRSASIVLLRLAHEKRPHALASKSIHTYRVPIGSDDFLYDKSERRWRALARHVYTIVLLVGIVALPLVYLTVAGIHRVNVRFGPKLIEGQPEDPNNWISRRQFVLFLRVYGYIEQTYAISQLAIFFIFSNIVISLFHADLNYKVRPILRELRTLCDERSSTWSWEKASNDLSNAESVSTITTTPDDESEERSTKTETPNALRLVYGNQLRIWSYFGQIKLYDSFMSRYAAISLAHLAIGVTFGQSFVRLDDAKLRIATIASISGNLLSFTYLHFVSEHIEQKSYLIYKRIFTILTGERDPIVKREWQRILHGFFMANQKRTFTMMGRFPTNIGFFIKAVTALLAVCTLIHRLFHRHQWDDAFAQGLKSSPAL